MKGVGLNAVKAIIDERNANGPYKDVYDFVERVNLSACNRGAIESLALAGAFDSSFTDCLVKYGQSVQNDKNSLQLSLFGELEPIGTNRPPFPEVEPWTQLALLNKEKELVTRYLSAHPLDPYTMEIKYGCTCTCAEFQQREEVPGNVTIAGLVTKVSTKVSRTGKEFSIVEIEDFSGKAEIRLFGRNHVNFRDKFHEGEAIFIALSYTPSRYQPDRTDMNIVKIEPLENIKGKIANSLTIFLDVDYNNEELFKKINECTGNKRSGELYLELIDRKTRQSVKIHSRRRYDIDIDMIELLEANGVRFKVSTMES